MTRRKFQKRKDDFGRSEGREKERCENGVLKSSSVSKDVSRGAVSNTRGVDAAAVFEGGGVVCCRGGRSEAGISGEDDLLPAFSPLVPARPRSSANTAWRDGLSGSDMLARGT